MNSLPYVGRHALAVLSISATVFLTACASIATPQPVATTIARTPELSMLSSLIDKAGLESALNGAGEFTVFAPSNDAFKAVPSKLMAELAANPSRLKEVLAYHVIASKAMAKDVKTGAAKTLQGSNIAIAKAGDFVTVEEAMVQKSDIAASNGVVHIVDRVLVPPARK